MAKIGTRAGDTWTPVAPESYRKKRCGGGSCGSHGGTSGGGCGHKSADSDASCGDCHSCPVSSMTELDREAVHRALMKAGYAGDRDHVPQLPNDWEHDEDDGSAAAESDSMTRDTMDTSTHMSVEDVEATGGPGGTRAVIGVRFPDTGKLYYFDPVDLDPRVGEWVVVETPRGRDAAKVLVARHQVVLNKNADPLKPVIRMITQDELARMEELGDDAAHALCVCAEKVEDARLPMKLIKAEYSFDASRITFYFSSESRVDFRALVRDLASEFRTRIELRQVGARDEAKLLGGVGRCGLTLCCSTWLPDYPPTSIKQAKEQDLPLNPAKISGVCGRLLCCLSYEYDTYVTLRRNLPRIGQRLGTPEGEGRVIAVQVLKQAVRVALDEGGTTEVELGDTTDRQWQGEAIAADAPPTSGRTAGEEAPITAAAQRPRPGRERPPAPMRGSNADRRPGSSGSDRAGDLSGRGGQQEPMAVGPSGTSGGTEAIGETEPGTVAEAGPQDGTQPAEQTPSDQPARRRRRRHRGRRKPTSQD